MRITGETRGELTFKSGDILFIRARSSAVFRGISMAIVADDNSAYLPIRPEILTYLGKDVTASRVTPASVKEKQGIGIEMGGSDGIMNSEWDSMNLPDAAEGGPDWFRGETSNDWHGWGLILSKELVKPLKER